MFDSVMSDDQLLGAVLGHYRAALGSSCAARRWLADRLISAEVAARFGVGFADRSLGLVMPRSNVAAGKVLRQRLLCLGLVRSSGHELFRGTVTVPIVGESDLNVGLYGHRIAANLPAGLERELWLPGRPGGMFNSVALATAGGVAVVASNIVVALSLISAGVHNVVAPGRPEGLSAGDLEDITKHAGAVVVVTGSGPDDGLIGVLEAAGLKTARVAAAPGASLAARIGSAIESLDASIDNNRSDSDADAQGSSRPAAVRQGDAPRGSDSDVTIDLGARVWRLRGVSRSAGFGALRANVTVTDTATGRFRIDTLDLYSARSRSAFLAGAGVDLHGGVDELGCELGRVILAAEEVADGAEPIGRDGQQPDSMSDAERDSAVAWLRRPDLAEAVCADVAALGVVGEADNALLVYLALTSRLADRPLSVMVQSSSAAGKSTLADTVASLMPPEARLSYSALTGQSLYYVAPDSLAHKVLVVAEEQGAARAVYAMRLLLSAGRLAIASTAKDKASGRLATRSYEVAGPVAALLTTSALAVDDELSSRLITITLGESIEQTRAIHAAQRAVYSTQSLVASADRRAVVSCHNNAQRLLRPWPVVIPMADQLSFSDATTRSRRDHDKYLGLIAASALLHQYQRPQATIDTAGGAIRYIEATADDVALAERLAAGVLVRDLSDLPPVTAAVLRRLGDWAADEPFSRRQARESLGLGDTQLKVHLARLVDLEYLIATRRSGAVFYRLAWKPTDSRPNRSGRSGSDPRRSGAGRAPVGGWSGDGRAASMPPSAQLNGQPHPAGDPSDDNHLSGVEGDPLLLRRRRSVGKARP